MKLHRLLSHPIKTAHLVKPYLKNIRSSGLFRNILLSLILLTFIRPSSTHAQNYELEFEHISIENGLSQSTVFTILQDRNGFLWFGTQDGLNRFDGYNFKVFKHDPTDSLSLSDNWVTSISEDHTGNIWVGTLGGGLCQFDPVREKFSTYLYTSDNKDNAVYNRVQVVLEDSDRQLWVGTEGGGLNKLDSTRRQFTNFKHDPGNIESICGNSVGALLEDRAGNLWIGTYDGGLSVIKKSNKESLIFDKYVHDPKDIYTLSSNHILSLFEDSSGKLWIGTDSGLNLYDPVNNQFWRFQHDPRDQFSLSNDAVYTIYEDVNQVLWIGTDGGINFYNQKNDRFSKSVHDILKQNSLSNDLVRTILRDASGTVWVGTNGGGLNHFDWRRKKFRHYLNVPGDPTSLSDNTVWSIMIARSGNLWIGTNKGLNRIDRNRHSVKVFMHEPFDPYSLSDDVVRVSYEDSRGDLWFGTNNGGVNRYNPLQKKFIRYMHTPADSNTISNNTIRAILEDKDGILWIGTWGGLNKLDPDSGKFTVFINDPSNPESISDDRVRCLMTDANGVLWVGTYKGLNKLDPETGTFKHYVNDPADSTSLSHDRVLSLYQDNSGIIWIATYGGGLNKFDPATGKFKVYREKDGLSNNAVYGILADGSGNLWMSSNKGISKFNPQTETFKNFDVYDGLQSDEFNGGAYTKSPQGELFFGGINGYNSFFPDKITENTYVPPVVLTNFKIFDQEVLLDSAITVVKHISLTYLDNFFSFEFAALDYTNPDKNKYMYKLEGFDRDWISSSNRRYANYTNLDGGEYVFHVKGSNSDGVWNDTGTAVWITIVPPFWVTWWFRLLSALVILSIGYFTYQSRMKKVEQQQKYLEDQIAERTWEIKERNKQLIIAKKETDSILHNVEEGIFLLNPKCEIESQYSRALESILECGEIARLHFLDLLENKVTLKIHTSVNEFISLMFDDTVDEDILVDLNPLSETEMTFENPETGGRITKHLSFNFRRIRNENGETSELIATVQDVSDQIRLTRELEESQEASRKQMEWMLSILHVEPQLLKEFMEGVTLELNYIDSVLRKSETESNLMVILEKIFRSMHLIKGNATLVDLKFFVEKAHEFEENIAHIREKEKISGSDFVPLVLMLKEMRNILGDLDNLIDRISNIHLNFRPKRNYENKIFLTSLANLIQTLSHDLNKKINFAAEGFDAGIIPYRFRLTSRQILIQMLRNSVYHGIENTEDRISAGKDETGVIELSSRTTSDAFELVLRDDGRGIQLDELRKKVLKSGKWSEEEVVGWSDERLADMIFETGISTLNVANLVAGRGVGMDLVRDRVEKAGGKISLKFEKQKYCEFHITIPLNEKKSRKKEVVQEVEA